MDAGEFLPSTEADLLAVLLKLPYQKRIGYALKLVNNYRNDPALLSLIQELLSTSLLPDRVPFPGKVEDGGYIPYTTLLFPQSNASKQFFQHELGLAMASALGEPGIPFLLDAIMHPSTAGKSRAISACATGATDEQLVEVYHKSVPVTQESLHAAMVAADRVEALKHLQLWKEPSPAAIIEPKCAVLQRELKLAKPLERDKIWTSAGLTHIRPHRHMHDPLYVPKGSKADLVTTLFDLLELYPPLYQTDLSDHGRDVPSIPSSLDGRIYSFLKCDISRALRLVRRTSYIPDLEHKQRDRLRLPSTFMHQRSSVLFWHMMSLKDQQKHLLPFILELMRVENQVLLKNGQLQSADLLPCARWQIIIAVANSALATLKNERTVQAISSSDRKGILSFVVYGIDTLVSRLYQIAHRKDATMSRSSIECELGNLLRHAVEYILAAFRVSAQSDEAFVKNFTEEFITPLLCGPLKQYPPLVEVLFDSIKGLFDIAQVSKSELHSTACRFLRALKRKKLSVFDIPNDGVVRSYCGIMDTDNDTVFRLLLKLTHPRDDLSLYVQVRDALSVQQTDVIWGYFNDVDYITRQVRKNGSLRSHVLGILKLASPRARLPFVMALLDHPNVDDAAALGLYSLLDVSDAPSREMLHKNTYKRLFTDRYRGYNCLVTATLEQRSVKESIISMKFLISRFKNEILPDAETLCGLEPDRQLSIDFDFDE